MLRLYIGLMLVTAHCGSHPSKDPEAGDRRAASDSGDEPEGLMTITPADQLEQDEAVPAETEGGGQLEGATETVQATAVLSRDVFTSTVKVGPEYAAIVSVFKNDSPTPLFTADVSEEICHQHYLSLETVENRSDIIVLRFGCIVGEDKKLISGTVTVFIATDTLVSVWSGVETTRILRDECWDESFIEVVSSDERIVKIVRVTQKQDRVTDPTESEFECPTAPRKENLTKEILP